MVEQSLSQTLGKEEQFDLHNFNKILQAIRGTMLLNTSLNIKGQPIVNDEKEAVFCQHYGVKVHVQD